MVCLFKFMHLFCLFVFSFMPIPKSDVECSVQLLIISMGIWVHPPPRRSYRSFADDKAPGDLIPQGDLGTPPRRSYRSFADDKAPGDLIPQMLRLNLLEKKIIPPPVYHPSSPLSLQRIIDDSSLAAVP